MWLSSFTAQSLAAFFITLAALVFLAPIARKMKLTDAPSQRKLHRGETPVIGGIAIFIALAVIGAIWGAQNQPSILVNGNDAMWFLIGCAAFLVITGALDDRFDLGVFTRVLSEMLVAVAVIEALNLKLTNLGDLFGFGLIQMTENLSYPFTVIAIFGIMNAFNMLDGMDGLLASLVLTTLVIFHLFTETQPSLVSLVVSASLLAFLASNLQVSPFIPKTFLGDAGSKLLGFLVVCLLLGASSDQVGHTKLIQPATALFIVALPLYDMVFTSLRRISQKQSPFISDRSHIHHLLLDLGFSDRRTLVILLMIHCAVALIGLVLHRAATPDHAQFAIFLGCFGIYCLLCSQLWLVVPRLRHKS